MKESLCGASCSECPEENKCSGCSEKRCFVANYITVGGIDSYRAFKDGLIKEINSLKIDGMDTVTELYQLVGNYVNLDYILPNGCKVKFLNDDEIYLGAQVRNLFDKDGKTCFGVIARENFLLVCEYGENCTNPEIIVYKRR